LSAELLTSKPDLLLAICGMVLAVCGEEEEGKKEKRTKIT